MNKENLEEIMKTLQIEAPGHLLDLLSAIDLVADEINYSKSIIDMSIEKNIKQNEYDHVKGLVDVSQKMHVMVEDLKQLVEMYNENEICSEGIIEPDRVQNRVDYNKFNVDNTVAYDLFSQLTYKKPAGFSFNGKFYDANTWQKVFCELCNILLAENEKLFTSLPDDVSMQGKKKPRFSCNPTLLRRPQMIGKSGVYVETNLSANDIRNSILALLKKFNFSSDTVKFFMMRDFSSLHTENE